MWLTIAALALGAASSTWNRVVQSQETKKELKTQKSNLETSYNNAVSQNSAYYGLMRQNATNNTTRANAYLNKQTGYLEANRDNAVEVAGRVLKDQTAINQAQIAALKIEGAKAEGAGVQQAATSGFRGTGSALNAKLDASESYRRSVATAQAQANLQRYSSYQDAVNAYTSATQQAELYKKQVEMNNSALQDQLNMYNKQQEWAKTNLDTQYEQNKKAIQNDIEYMNDWRYFTAQALGIGADMFGAASDIYSLFGGNGAPDTRKPNEPIRDYTLDDPRTRKGSRAPR